MVSVSVQFKARFLPVAMRLLLLGMFPLMAAFAENPHKPTGPVKFDNLPASTVPGLEAVAPQTKTGTKLAPYVPSRTVLYSAVWCGYCRQAKAYLAKRRIAYQEFDVDTRDGRAAFASDGGRSVPLLVVGGQRVRGFSAAAYDTAFANQK